MKKINLSILVILIAALGFIVAVIYRNIKIQPNISGNTSTLLDTSDWKTYTNQVYGFSFKYPDTETALKCGGESSNKPNQISGPADGTEKECVFMTPSFIRVDILDSTFDAAISKGEAIVNKETDTTIAGKRVYSAIHEVSPVDSAKTKQVFTTLTDNKTLNLSGNYDKSQSILLFDTVYSTLKLR